MADSIERFSYELTAAALAEQERTVNGLRTSAGTVLAAASIAGSFLAATTAGRPLDGWAVGAVVTFALCVGSAIWVLVPHRFVFALRGQMLSIVSDRQEVDDVSEAHRTVSNWFERCLSSNGGKIDRLSTWLARSCVLLAAEVTLWTISIVA